MTSYILLLFYYYYYYYYYYCFNCPDSVYLLAIYTDLITNNRRNFIRDVFIFFNYKFILDLPLEVVIILITSAMISAIYMELVHHPLSYDSHVTQLLFP